MKHKNSKAIHELSHVIGHDLHNEGMKRRKRTVEEYNKNLLKVT